LAHVRTALNEGGTRAMEAWLASLDEPLDLVQVEGEVYRYKNTTVKRAFSVFGPLRVRRRLYQNAADDRNYCLQDHAWGMADHFLRSLACLPKARRRQVERFSLRKQTVVRVTLTVPTVSAEEHKPCMRADLPAAPAGQAGTHRQAQSSSGKEWSGRISRNTSYLTFHASPDSESPLFTGVFRIGRPGVIRPLFRVFQVLTGAFSEVHTVNAYNKWRAGDESHHSGHAPQPEKDS
jgi:hypothetical protein